MPTVSRYLLMLGLLAAIAYGAMFALANLVTPRQAEMTVRVPLDGVRPGTAPLTDAARLVEEPSAEDPAPDEAVPDEANQDGPSE